MLLGMYCTRHDRTRRTTAHFLWPPPHAFSPIHTSSHHTPSYHSQSTRLRVLLTERNNPQQSISDQASAAMRGAELALSALGPPPPLPSRPASRTSRERPRTPPPHFPTPPLPAQARPPLPSCSTRPRSGASPALTQPSYSTSPMQPQNDSYASGRARTPSSFIWYRWFPLDTTAHYRHRPLPIRAHIRRAHISRQHIPGRPSESTVLVTVCNGVDV